jgi:hypothetical protein
MVASAVGCASITPAGDQVRLTNNPQATAGCQFLGNLKVASDDNKLRNQAASLGANVVYSYSRPFLPIKYSLLEWLTVRWGIVPM